MQHNIVWTAVSLFKTISAAHFAVTVFLGVYLILKDLINTSTHLENRDNLSLLRFYQWFLSPCDL